MANDATNVPRAFGREWLARLIEGVKRLLTPPNLGDSKAVRDWLRGLLDLGEKLADVLPEPVQRGLALLKEVTASDAVWEAFYRLLLYFHSSEHEIVSLAGALEVAEEPEVEHHLGRLAGAMAGQAGGPPSVSGFDLDAILELVAAIVALLKELRKS